MIFPSGFTHLKVSKRRSHLKDIYAFKFTIVCLDDSGAKLPAVVFYHGGGFIFGGLDSHDCACRRICVESGVVVIAVDYRVASEHPFPAAVIDCYATLE